MLHCIALLLRRLRTFIVRFAYFSCSELMLRMDQLVPAASCSDIQKVILPAVVVNNSSSTQFRNSVEQFT